MHDDSAADGKSPDCAKCHSKGELWAQAENIGEHCNQCTEYAEEVEPFGCAQRNRFLPVVKCGLQQQSCQADRRNHYDGYGAVEGAGFGVDDNQGEQATQDAGTDYGPSPERRPRVGS